MWQLQCFTFTRERPKPIQMTTLFNLLEYLFTYTQTRTYDVSQIICLLFQSIHIPLFFNIIAMYIWDKFMLYTTINVTFHIIHIHILFYFVLLLFFLFIYIFSLIVWMKMYIDTCYFMHTIINKPDEVYTQKHLNSFFKSKK